MRLCHEFPISPSVSLMFGVGGWMSNHIIWPCVYVITYPWQNESFSCLFSNLINNDDVIKWKHFPLYWPYVRGIHHSPVRGEFTAQRRVTRSFGVFFDLRLNKWLSKQSWGWWFETLSRQLWRHCDDICRVFLWRWCSTSMQVIFHALVVIMRSSAFVILL